MPREGGRSGRANSLAGQQRERARAREAERAREARRAGRRRDREGRERRDHERHRRLTHRLLPALGGAGGVAIILGLLFSGAFGGSGSSPTTAAQRAAAKRPPAQMLPRGGRTLLPGHLVVAYYGIVGTTNILGRTHNPEQDAAGVEREAARYAKLGQKVQPAFELVTTVASSDPGSDGTYSSAVSTSTVERYLKVAHRHKLLLILDFQPGRGNFLPQVERYRRFLTDPSVGVALDPEWKLTGDEVPDEAIGSSGPADINDVSAYLSRLVAQDNLPQKLFVVHEFKLGELKQRGQIAFRPGLATVLQMDGLGTVATKLAAYRMVQRFARGFIPGFKVFTLRTQDPVLMTPGQVLGLRPRPQYISYQ